MKSRRAHRLAIVSGGVGGPSAAMRLRRADVEVAGQIAELSRHVLRHELRRIEPAEARIVLLDRGPAILKAFPESLRRPEVFVIGDLMNLGHLPGVSQVAIQFGRHAADPPPPRGR